MYSCDYGFPILILLILSIFFMPRISCITKDALRCGGWMYIFIKLFEQAGREFPATVPISA